MKTQETNKSQKSGHKPKPKINDHELAHALTISMCAPLMNMIKLCMGYASKNRAKAEKPDLQCAIEMLGTYLLPDFCIKYQDDLETLNYMHDLMVYFSKCARKVFQSSVIAATINNNRDLDAFKRCLNQILQMLYAHEPDLIKQRIGNFFDEWNYDQMSKSDICLTKIYNLLNNHKRQIQEMELIQITDTFETDFEFIQQDLDTFRQQGYN